jgi:hypothetical protein
MRPGRISESELRLKIFRVERTSVAAAAAAATNAPIALVQKISGFRPTAAAEIIEAACRGSTYERTRRLVGRRGDSDV